MKWEWIKTSDELPKEYKKVLICMPNGGITTGKYDDAVNVWFKGEMYAVGGDDPIAWSPLPEPYKAESEDKE